MNLTTEAALAEQFGITPAKAAELRKRKGWPHVRVTRFDVRYTPEQIEQIIAALSVAPSPVVAAADTGLTERSAARSA